MAFTGLTRPNGAAADFEHLLVTTAYAGRGRDLAALELVVVTTIAPPLPPRPAHKAPVGPPVSRLCCGAVIR